MITENDMALKDYTTEIRIKKRKLYVALCVYIKKGRACRSPVNEMIEIVISDLKKELMDYEEIRIAYVFETDGLQGCVPFERMTAETMPYYTEPKKDSSDHNLDHVFFMSMALLEDQNREERGECRLYLITDEKIERSNEIQWMEEGNTIMNPRFEDLNTKVMVVAKPGDKNHFSLFK